MKSGLLMRSFAAFAAISLLPLASAAQASSAAIATTAAIVGDSNIIDELGEGRRELQTFSLTTVRRGLREGPTKAATQSEAATGLPIVANIGVGDEQQRQLGEEGGRSLQAPCAICLCKENPNCCGCRRHQRDRLLRGEPYPDEETL